MENNNGDSQSSLLGKLVAPAAILYHLLLIAPLYCRYLDCGFIGVALLSTIKKNPNKQNKPINKQKTKQTKKNSYLSDSIYIKLYLISNKSRRILLNKTVGFFSVIFF